MSTARADAQRNVVALLSAWDANDPPAAALITGGLDRMQLVGTLIATVRLLHHEISLGCAEAGITVATFLEQMGLAFAEEAT